MSRTNHPIISQFPIFLQLKHMHAQSLMFPMPTQPPRLRQPFFTQPAVPILLHAPRRVQYLKLNKCFATLTKQIIEVIEKKQKEAERCTSKLFPMTGGQGQYSYTNNSSFQKIGLDRAKKIMHEEITKKVDGEEDILLSPPDVFRITDMGCAAGPNTFVLVQDVIEAVKSKYQSNDIEFQVFFNDHSGNDFNTLFNALPEVKNYHAAGVPGSFYSRLFPKSSLHFVHSSYAIPWLSKVPEQVNDKNSPAWNKGRILYENSKQVEAVYAAQFASDFDMFLKARAEELVPGGFVVLLFPTTHGEDNKCIMVKIFEILGSTLVDMAKMGVVEESKIDSFNLHLYFAPAAEVKSIVEKNGSFKIEQMEQLDRPMPDNEKLALVIRAASEEIVTDHFGGEIIDELYNKFEKKLGQSGLLMESRLVPKLDLFTLLKRVG